MSIFRRATRPPQHAGEPWPEMPPRPPLYQRASDPGLKGAWVTQAPLDPAEDPCGRPPVALSRSESGERA